MNLIPEGLLLEQAAVKILVNLADEWLEDENIAVEKKDKIARILLKYFLYIHTFPFSLAHITENEVTR